MSSAMHLLTAALVGVLFVPTGVAMAQTTTEQIKDDITRKEAELRQKQLELQLIQADIDIAKATQAAGVTEATALAEAEKTLAKAETDAKIAKQIGEVKNASYSGAVDLGDKTGTVEARLLATKAVAAAAAKIVKDLGETRPTVLVLPDRSFDSFSNYMAYEFRKQIVTNALTSVLPKDTTTPPAAGIAGAAAPAVISAGLDAMGKLLSFFKTDYKFGGIDVSLDESVAIAAVAGQLKANPGIKVLTPKMYMLQEQDKAIKALVADLQALVSLRSRAASEQRLHKARMASHVEDAAKATDANQKKESEKKAEAEKEQIARIQSAIDIYDQFSASITATPAEGQKLPLLNLVEEKAIWTMANEPGTGVLLVRLEVTGGGYVVKKSMWTGLGGAPLYHMGGSAITYTFLDGQQGTVLAAGTVAVHGGFVKSSELAELLSNPNPSPDKK